MLCVYDGGTVTFYKLSVGQCTKAGRADHKNKWKFSILGFIGTLETRVLSHIVNFLKGTALVCPTSIYCSWSNVSNISANRYFCDC